MNFEKMLLVYDEAIKLQGDRELSDFDISMLLQESEANVGVRLANTEMIPLITMVAKGRAEHKRS